MFASNPMELLGSLGTVSLLVLFTLLLFSVSSWGIIVYKWRMFQAAEREEHQFLEEFDRLHMNPKDIGKLKSLVHTLPLSPSGAVFAGLFPKLEPRWEIFGTEEIIERQPERRRPPRHYLEKVVQSIIQGQISRQEQYLPFLATTGNITPFIGLFGTVIGVINAFQEIGEQGTASIAAVAPGVSEALVATAAGLFAAIPAVVAYNFFLTKIRKSAYRVEAFSIEFLNIFDQLASEENEAEVLR